MTRRRVILSVINDLVTDQRVHKMATTLQTAGWEVLVVGRKLPNSLPLQRTYATHRMRLCFQKGKLFYLEFQIRLFLFLIHQPKAILVANDLDTLLPNVLCKWIRKIPVVYDSHEIFTQVPELIHRPISQFIWKTLETWLIPHTNLILTVNRSLVEWFSQSYQKHAIAFHNVPFQQEKVDLASRKPNVLLYQGALNVGRGIELMISTMKLLPECELWLVGDGDIRETLEKQVQELQVDRQVTFWGKRPFSELFAITVQATIGLSLEEDLGENYRRSTPNKIFDYYQARLPMIVSDLPGIRSVFDPFPAGMILTNRTPEALASAIKELLLPSNYQRAVEIAEQAAIQYCWEHQIPQLLSSYEQLIHSQG